MTTGVNRSLGKIMKVRFGEEMSRGSRGWDAVGRGLCEGLTYSWEFKGRAHA